MNKISTKEGLLHKLPLWIWVILPSLLFWLAWHPISLTPLLFVSFLPFIVLSNRLFDQKGYKYFGLLYLSLLGWNLTTTWWVYYASSWGAIAMLILNSIFMLFPFGILRRLKRKNYSNAVSWSAFIIAWLLYEYGHHRWDLSWPWLCLGNGFSGMVNLVQWYEFTGTLGGSLWVLLVNILAFFTVFTSPENTLSNTSQSRTDNVLENSQDKTDQGSTPNTLDFSKVNKLLPTALLVSIVLPVLVSITLKFVRNIDEGKPINVAVLQPSFDPWNEKFVRNPLDLEQEMIQLSRQTIDSTTNWLLWPETSLVSNIDMKSPDVDPQIQMVKSELLAKYPNLNLLTGVNGIEYYQSASKPNRSARKSQYDAALWYNLYNSALLVKQNGPTQIYHKSKLVPGTEQMPFIQTLPFLESLAISLDENSSTGSLGVSEKATALGDQNSKTAPIICYESIYGDYVGQYVKDGAQWLGILTNDAWWNKTAGYQQHFSYAKLRAIEFRKWVARSANTGTSGFIDPLGNTVQSSGWYEKQCLQQTIYSNDTKTIYFHLGDKGVLLIFIVLIIVANAIFLKLKKA
jgi:apolipoprotein N-acyltransferase